MTGRPATPAKGFALAACVNTAVALMASGVGLRGIAVLALGAALLSAVAAVAVVISDSW